MSHQSCWRAEEYVSRGMAFHSRRAGKTEALRASSCNPREHAYDVRGGGWVESCWQDLRYGAAVLRSNGRGSPRWWW